jgi:signal transduction histidine kinase
MQKFVNRNRNKVNNAILNHLHEAVVLLSIDGVILYVNKHVGELLNTTFNSQDIGSHFTTFLHQDSIDTALTDLKDLVEGKKIKAVAYRFNSINEMDIWLKVAPQLVSIMGTPMILLSLYDVVSRKNRDKTFQEKKYNFNPDDLGRLIGDNFPDIERELEELRSDNDNLIIELSLAKEKVEEAVKLKNALLKNMSHEFRTPLNGILGFSSLLTEAIDDEDLKQMTLIISESGKRLLHTLDAVLAMSQLESGIVQIDDELIDFYETTISILDDYAKIAIKKGITFSFECLHKFQGYIDLSLYSLIVNNLLDNALKFTYKGAIDIHLNLAVINNQNILILKVADTGIGISSKFQKVIFKEFFKVESGNIQCLEGVGLGLTLVRKSLTLLGGDITLESMPNIGSTFTVYIPLNKFSLKIR